MSRETPSLWIPIREPITLAVLGKLGEEAGELSSAVARCLIQGVDSCDPETGKLNRVWLEDEIADVMANAALAREHLHLDGPRMLARMAQKKEHKRAWHRMLAEHLGIPWS